MPMSGVSAVAKPSIAQVFLAALPEHRRRAVSTFDMHDGVRSALLRAPGDKATSTSSTSCSAHVQAFDRADCSHARL